MAPRRYCLFETAIGVCAIAWGEAGIIGTQLPEGDEDSARERMRRRFPDASEAEPAGSVAETVAAIRRLMRDGIGDLSDAKLDMAPLPAFNRSVYEIAREIRPGETRTYGEIAARLGRVSAAREVGAALGQNPFPIIVPCHRVLAARGGTGGFSARGGVRTKLRLLTIERARTDDSPLLFDDLPLAARC